LQDGVQSGKDAFTHTCSNIRHGAHQARQQASTHSRLAALVFSDRSDEEVVAKSPKYAKASSARGSSANLAAAGTGSGDGGAAAADSSTPKSGAGPLSSSAAAAAAAGDGGGGDALSRKRAYKEKWQEAVALFNIKPKKGIAMLQVRPGSLACVQYSTHSKLLFACHARRGPANGEIGLQKVPKSYVTVRAVNCGCALLGCPVRVLQLPFFFTWQAGTTFRGRRC
jgi:hypothetical protein